MIKIVLVCVAGLSTSMLKRNMQKAKVQYKQNIVIEAISVNDLELTEEIDVLLVGPQIAHLFKKIKTKYVIPVLQIKNDDYSSLNGESVLEVALKYHMQHIDKQNVICIIDKESAYTTLLIEKFQEFIASEKTDVVIKGITEKEFPLYHKPMLYLIEPRIAYKSAVFQKETTVPIMDIEQLDYSILDVSTILEKIIQKHFKETKK